MIISISRLQAQVNRAQLCGTCVRAQAWSGGDCLDCQPVLQQSAVNVSSTAATISFVLSGVGL